ncbi:hypothetical protein GCM10010381_04160 [Streptomyces xantholiticus]|nr:hypothetical protein GCM10010381_04160 [Streptomyces xantholiticus]
MRAANRIHRLGDGVMVNSGTTDVAIEIARNKDGSVVVFSLRSARRRRRARTHWRVVQGCPKPRTRLWLRDFVSDVSPRISLTTSLDMSVILTLDAAGAPGWGAAVR